MAPMICDRSTVTQRRMEHRVQRRFSIARDDGKNARTGEEDQRYPGFSVPGTISTSDGPSLLPVLNSSRTANERHHRVSLAHQEPTAANRYTQGRSRRKRWCCTKAAVRPPRQQFPFEYSHRCYDTGGKARQGKAKQRVLSRPLVCSRESEKRRDRATEVPADWREKGSTRMHHASARALIAVPW